MLTFGCLKDTVELLFYFELFLLKLYNNTDNTYATTPLLFFKAAIERDGGPCPWWLIKLRAPGGWGVGVVV